MPKEGKNLIIYLQDLNLPNISEWGIIDALELYRQILSQNGFHSTKKDNVGKFS